MLPSGGLHPGVNLEQSAYDDTQMGIMTDGPIFGTLLSMMSEFLVLGDGPRPFLWRSGLYVLRVSYIFAYGLCHLTLLPFIRLHHYAITPSHILSTSIRMRHDLFLSCPIASQSIDLWFRQIINHSTLTYFVFAIISITQFDDLTGHIFSRSINIFYTSYIYLYFVRFTTHFLSMDRSIFKLGWGGNQGISSLPSSSSY
jgi:hypothetical protein